MNSVPHVIRVLRCFPKWAWLGWFCWAALAFVGTAQILPPNLTLDRLGRTNGWPYLSSSSQSNLLLTLETSTDLKSWQSIGVFHDGVFQYPDMHPAGFNSRFYRLRAGVRGPDHDWKNQIQYPKEPFISTNDFSEMRWVKFAILLNDSSRVYYQDGKFPFHYDFASQRLEPFRGMSRAAFESVSMHRTNQQVILGSVLYPPSAGYYPPGTVFSECGVQFAGVDPYTPDEIARWFELVKATVYAPDGASFFYMPSFEQSDMARTNAEVFAGRDVPVASVDRWVAGNTCYAAGWALGRLKYFSANEITAAFTDGRLRPEDILLTDGVPAETPTVSGIISLKPSTPNSHTAILAQSFGIPFCYVSDAGEQARLQSLVGRKILLRVTTSATTAYGEKMVKVLDVDGILDPALEAEILAIKQTRSIEYKPKQQFGAFSALTDTFGPSDIRFFGGKAANYGLLRRCVPTNCPVAIAFSFDLWDAYLDQKLPNGITLRTEVANRLAPYTNYPPDILSLKADLAAIRSLFTKTARFTPAQQQAITNALSIFNPARKIRFRSSTNVEDSEHFTGAGLYDSYSGCLPDDLDNDAAGPCRCELTEPEERGVFRAIQKVYASFYNDNAFLERLRHKVDETQAGMGVLVHHSFPDEEELANGVTTLQFTTTAYNQILSGDMVSQLGADSVTNPQGTSIPEVVHVWADARYSNLFLVQRSSRVPLGGYVMEWQRNYGDFLRLFAAIGAGFHQNYPNKNSFLLDFEYKKDAISGLVVKQVREVPPPATNRLQSPFLIDEPAVWSPAQAADNVFASHRLKSIWRLHATNMRLADTNLVHGIFSEGTVEYLEDGTLRTLAGPLSFWPNASNSVSGYINSWTTGSGAEQKTWHLESALATGDSGLQVPILTQQDFRKTVSIVYATPVPTILGFF
ncbi:MAG TPA: PEP/pyruvate-binding domain-containing protein, partial [Clostridia bacterium]|nr:PEP/pyruvate-binding domain-containing protein [Clostridia bacterium]